MNIKSERLKKLESELRDLEQWLKLGLVPKKDLEKHKTEITSLKQKIEEEKERYRYLKESGELEEYTAPKRTAGRQAFQESPTIPDIDVMEDSFSEAGLEAEAESYETETSAGLTTGDFGDDEEGEEELATVEEEDEEDPFSDRNRWRRGVLEDPDGGGDW